VVIFGLHAISVKKRRSSFERKNANCSRLFRIGLSAVRRRMTFCDVTPPVKCYARCTILYNIVLLKSPGVPPLGWGLIESILRVININPARIETISWPPIDHRVDR
jgi:hypothetical protein